jgi:nitrous oxidase accessory protein
VLAGVLAFLLQNFSIAVYAEIREIEAGASLQDAINKAGARDTLILQAGVYSGPIVIDRPLELLGNNGVIIDGQGVGRVVSIAASDVTVRGLTIRNSGDSLATEDAGIFVTPEGDRAQVEDNLLTGNLIGIYLKGPDNALVRNNVIIGSKNPHVNDRGNGVQLWNTPGSVVEGNDISLGRDGIFVTTSRDNIFRNNIMRDLRFAVHYMYTNDSTVAGNQSSGNHVGYALMYSNNLEVHNNVSDGDRDRGLFLNFANESNISGNQINGAEKCFFIYNANYNRIDKNHFSNCEIGIHFTAGSEGNDVYGNAFVDNRTQVKYVGTRYVEWSLNGRGNFWSDNPAFDLDDDGIADQAYLPNDMVDQLLWRHPLAKLLLNSPAMQVLRWAQSEFPSLHPGGVSDSVPLMSFEQGGYSEDG